MNKGFTYLLLLLLSHQVYAQEDSLKNIDLSEIVVTATRGERLLSAVPVPVTLIAQKQIKQMGSLRLNEILQEQTGLAVVNDHGQGIQMQGFNPDYTLILIDGEPLIGRTAGTLELSRLAVGNIKQIEIVKGPSSSLYGSEALAGVINIITESPRKTKLSFTSRYGTNQTVDFGLSASFKQEKLGGNIFINRYSSAGYDFTPNTFGQTVEPFHNYTLQSKWTYDFSDKVRLNLSGRYFVENQDSRFQLGNQEDAQRVEGYGKVKDYNLNPTLDWRVNDRFKTQFRLYHSVYKTESELRQSNDNQLFEETFFTQTFLRPEVQVDYYLNDQHQLTLGIGNIWESVEATRYSQKRQFETRYIFAQYEFVPNQKWDITLGGRFDAHTVYGSQFSPKLSIQYQVNDKFLLRASAGRGFKSPDFRQLYLNFTNAVAGYSVFGTEELPSILAQLEAQGQLAGVLLDPSEVGNLQAESSWAFNLGLQHKPHQKITWNLNLFRNDVSNLIESQVVATRTNGQNIFSYRNLNSIFTQGLETDVNYQIASHLSFSAGYQYLIAKDKEILVQIDNGELFRRNPQTLQTERIRRADYGGLFGRSRNMLNLKLFYDNPNKGFTANLRAIYRGRYGFGDLNGNLVLDQDNEYVEGFWTLNFATSQEFWKKRLRGQIGIDNLLNFSNQTQIPSLAGRLIWASMQLNLGG